MKKYPAIVLLVSVTFFLTAARAGAFPEAGRKYALIYVIDGIPTPEFMEMLANGELPNFREHLYERGIHSENHITVYPSLTFPAMVSVFSGCYPSTLGVPNFFWVDRKRGIYKNFFSEEFDEYEHYINPNVRMLLDYFPHERTLCFALSVNAGHATYQRELYGEFLDRFRELRDVDYIAKAVEKKHTIAPDMLVKPCKLISLFNPAKDANILSLINPISKRGALRYAIGSFSKSARDLRNERPELIIYYDWRADHYGHEAGTDSREVLGSIIDDDVQFGKIVDVYRKAGLYDDTYFVLCSDHSQLPIDAHHVNIVDMFVAKGFKAKLISQELVAHEGIKGIVHIGSLLVPGGKIRGYNCLVGTSGADLVSVFLSKDGGTGLESWGKEIYYNDILHYPVTADAYVNIEDFIKSIEHVNLFLVREKEFLPGQPHVTRIVNRGGSALVSAQFDKTKPVELEYEIVKGVDPLGYSEYPALARMISSGYHSDREWLKATAQTNYPDALVQIAQAMELDRMGSIIIEPDEKYSFNAYSRSKHGGLTARQVKSVFAIAGPGLGRGIIEYSRTADMVPTLLRLLGKDPVAEPMDGIVLPDISPHVAESQ